MKRLLLIGCFTLCSSFAFADKSPNPPPPPPPNEPKPASCAVAPSEGNAHALLFGGLLSLLLLNRRRTLTPQIPRR